MVRLTSSYSLRIRALHQSHLLHEMHLFLLSIFLLCSTKIIGYLSFNSVFFSTNQWEFLLCMIGVIPNNFMLLLKGRSASWCFCYYVLLSKQDMCFACWANTEVHEFETLHYNLKKLASSGWPNKCRRQHTVVDISLGLLIPVLERSYGSNSACKWKEITVRDTFVLRFL